MDKKKQTKKTLFFPLIERLCTYWITTISIARWFPAASDHKSLAKISCNIIDETQKGNLKREASYANSNAKRVSQFIEKVLCLVRYPAAALFGKPRERRVSVRGITTQLSPITVRHLRGNYGDADMRKWSLMIKWWDVQKMVLPSWKQNTLSTTWASRSNYHSLDFNQNVTLVQPNDFLPTHNAEEDDIQKLTRNKIPQKYKQLNNSRYVFCQLP